MNGNNNPTPPAASPASTPNPGTDPSSNPGNVTPPVTPSDGAPVTKSWVEEHLPQEYHTDETLKRFKGIPDLAKSYLDGRKKYGDPDKLLKLPEEGDAKGWSELYDKLGRPKTAGDYEIESVEGLEYDKNLIPKYQEFFHKLDLPKAKVKELTKGYAAMRVEEHKAAAAAEQQAQQADLIKLQASLGDRLEVFNDLTDQTFRALDEKLGGRLLKKLESKGLLHDPVILEMLAEVGQQNIEDGMRAGRGKSTINMGAADAQAEIESFQNDPEMRAAILNDSHPKHHEAKKRHAELFAKVHKTAQHSSI